MDRACFTYTVCSYLSNRTASYLFSFILILHSFLVIVILTGIWGGVSGFRIPGWGERFLSAPKSGDRLLGSSNEQWDSFAEVDWPGRDGDQSHLLAEVKNEWSCPSTPPSCLHSTGRGNLIFYINS
jgi:hypothetical protein